VTGDWRKLHNEELHDLYSLPNMTAVIKSRLMTWAHMWHTYIVGKSEGKRPLARHWHKGEYKIEIEWESWTQTIWLETGTTGGSCVYETSGSIKCGTFLDLLMSH